jgi:hypothetical protein
MRALHFLAQLGQAADAIDFRSGRIGLLGEDAGGQQETDADSAPKRLSHPRRAKPVF